MGFLYVFLGGGAGSVCRYILGKIIIDNVTTRFPLGTVCVNCLGCLAIGFLTVLFDRINASSGTRLLFATGFLGGFTTFSTFNLESVLLLRESNYSNAVLNIVLSLALGLLCVAAGMFIAGAVAGKGPYPR